MEEIGPESSLWAVWTEGSGFLTSETDSSSFHSSNQSQPDGEEKQNVEEIGPKLSVWAVRVEKDRPKSSVRVNEIRPKSPVCVKIGPRSPVWAMRVEGLELALETICSSSSLRPARQSQPECE